MDARTDMSRWITTFTVLVICTLPGCLVEFDESLLDRKDAGDAAPDAAVDFAVDLRGDAPAGEAQPDAGTDLPPDTAACTTFACQGNKLMACGKEQEVCALGCVTTPAPRCQRLVPSNGLPSPESIQVKDLVISANKNLDACTGKLGTNVIKNAIFKTKSQPGGPTVGVLQLRSLTVNPGVTLTVVGACALAVVADAKIDIGGDVKLLGGQSNPEDAGPGGEKGGDTTKAGGCGAGQDSDQKNTGGGGGGAAFGGGGAGGAATTFGVGGAPCGTDALIPLVGGSGGGRGGCSNKLPCSFGEGGGGGGALALVSGVEVSMQATGGINVGGAGGEGGIQGKSGGGGGGSGGGILIEAPVVSLDALAELAAGGGGGGGITTGSPVAARGQKGKLGISPAAGGNDKNSGGDGSSGSTPAGSPGKAGSGVVGGGGGGGGQGRIRVNTQSGSATLPVIHGSATQGTLTIN